MNVGDTVLWSDRFGNKVHVEYRGKVYGVDGWEACIIVWDDEIPPVQLMVPLSELSPVPSGIPV